MSISISAPTNRIFIVGAPDDDDFDAVSRMLRAREWNVRNTQADLEFNLRHQLGIFLECQAVCLLETWWTTAEGHMLHLLAGSTRTPFIDAFSGEVLS